ncbi:MAG: 2-haloacrylate reductase, partial [Rhodoferax sp.]|nr:2-haloacrylate reductase [Rhodoferax sp.]
MKTILCERHGPPEVLVLRELPARKPGAGEVLIDVHASALNYPDTLII